MSPKKSVNLFMGNPPRSYVCRLPYRKGSQCFRLNWRTTGNQSNVPDVHVFHTGMLTRPEKSGAEAEAEARCYEAEAKDVA